MLLNAPLVSVLANFWGIWALGGSEADPGHPVHLEPKKRQGAIETSYKCGAFFKLLKGDSIFQWNDESESALADLKRNLHEPPILTVPSVGEALVLRAVSAVLVREKGKKQSPVYYVSWTVLDLESKYPQLQKLLLALMTTVRKLNHYFHAHPIRVMMSYPLKSLLDSSDLSGRVAKWAMELGQYEVEFILRTAIKGQVLADYITEFVQESSGQVLKVWRVKVDQQGTWELQIDGAKNRRRAEAGLVLTSSTGEVIRTAGWTLRPQTMRPSTKP
ncbi:hypothetical protein V2J09_001023 [Rumex salicifolius]